MEPITHQKLIRAIKGLPVEALPDLANYIDFLQFKMSLTKSVYKNKTPSDFLMSIAGLGASDEDDVSEKGEDILNREINCTSGWTVKE